MSDFPRELCTDCRDSVLTTDKEKQYRLCATCLADQLDVE